MFRVSAAVAAGAAGIVLFKMEGVIVMTLQLMFFIICGDLVVEKPEDKAIDLASRKRNLVDDESLISTPMAEAITKSPAVLLRLRKVKIQTTSLVRS